MSTREQLVSWRGRQWISEGAGQSEFLEKFDIFGSPVANPPPLPSTALAVSSTILPPETTCRYLSGIFLKSRTATLFPLLERGLFDGTIARAYDFKACDLGRGASAKACLWAMLLLVSRTEEARQINFLLEPDACVQEIRRLLVIVNGAVNLDCLEAALLLVSQHEPASALTLAHFESVGVSKEEGAMPRGFRHLWQRMSHGM